MRWPLAGKRPLGRAWVLGPRTDRARRVREGMGTASRLCLLALSAFTSGLGGPLMAQESGEGLVPEPALRLAALTHETSAQPHPRRSPPEPSLRLMALAPVQALSARGAVPFRRVGGRLPETESWQQAGGVVCLSASTLRFPAGSFYESLDREARRYSVWGTRRLHLADTGEPESRSGDISRVAERIFLRATDRFLGRKFENLLYRSQTVERLRRAIDHYTAVRFQNRRAAIGYEIEAPEKVAAVGPVLPERLRLRASVRLRLDLHPKLLLKAQVGATRARLEVPFSGSEYRLSLRRPLSSSVSSELFAAYPRSGSGHPRAGLYFFLMF